jgi:hypothetical protein
LEDIDAVIDREGDCRDSWESHEDHNDYRHDPFGDYVLIASAVPVTPPEDRQNTETDEREHTG